MSVPKLKVHDEVVSVRPSVVPLLVNVTVALFRVCVPEFVQVEQSEAALSCSEYMKVALSPASAFPAVPVPFASFALVRAGTVVSIVTVRPALEGETVPAPSVAGAVSGGALFARTDLALGWLP